MNDRRMPRSPDVTSVELIGGPEPVEVTLHEYDERWPDIYREHASRIAAALEGLGATVEHIGSTSVRGLAAKPIVDIVVAVGDITAEGDYLGPLIATGYELRVREPGHRMVRTRSRDVHVHILERGDPALDDYLLLRDHLRSNADDRVLYESTKRGLLTRRWDDMNDYADAKTEVIVAIKERARAARAGVRLVRADDVDAWKRLYRGYRAFYSLHDDDAILDRTWGWVLNGEHSMIGLVAVDETGDSMGLANLRLFARPSSGALGLYLDDLFTGPESRGRGVATSLLHAAARLAAERGAVVVRWITDVDNTAARRVYDANAVATRWVTYDMAATPPPA